MDPWGLGVDAGPNRAPPAAGNALEPAGADGVAIESANVTNLSENASPIIEAEPIVAVAISEASNAYSMDVEPLCDRRIRAHGRHRGGVGEGGGFEAMAEKSECRLASIALDL